MPLTEHLLVIIDQVHLVHGDHDLLEAEEREQEAVASGLFAQPLVGVHEEHRGIGARRAGDHVFEEFLVARGVDDGVGPPRRAEGHARGVHGDVLRLLLEQRVHQEGVFEFHALGLARGLDALGLAVLHGMRVEQKPADERRFSVIDVTDDDEGKVVEGRGSPRLRLGLRGFGPGRSRIGDSQIRRCAHGGGVGHHMKPLARSFCIALRSWWSCARPARSDTRVTFSSSMMSAMVAALLSTGLLIGMQPSER